MKRKFNLILDIYHCLDWSELEGKSKGISQDHKDCNEAYLRMAHEALIRQAKHIKGMPRVNLWWSSEGFTS